tara:strand:- start:186 stop:353 length:168 start_codon:yes stop_codon:yes gene_type:complete
VTNKDDKRLQKELESMVYPLKNHLKYLGKLKKDLKYGKATPMRKRDLKNSRKKKK